jgi:hypothetical protein
MYHRVFDLIHVLRQDRLGMSARNEGLGIIYQGIEALAQHRLPAIYWKAFQDLLAPTFRPNNSFCLCTYLAHLPDETGTFTLRRPLYPHAKLFISNFSPSAHVSLRKYLKATTPTSKW